MIILKMLGKLLAIPALLVTSLVWLVVKAMTAIYGLCYGLLGIGVVAAMILFLGLSRVGERHCIDCDWQAVSICRFVCRNLCPGIAGRNK